MERSQHSSPAIRIPWVPMNGQGLLIEIKASVMVQPVAGGHQLYPVLPSLGGLQTSIEWNDFGHGKPASSMNNGAFGRGQGAIRRVTPLGRSSSRRICGDHCVPLKNDLKTTLYPKEHLP